MAANFYNINNTVQNAIVALESVVQQGYDLGKKRLEQLKSEVVRDVRQILSGYNPTVVFNDAGIEKQRVVTNNTISTRIERLFKRKAAAFSAKTVAETKPLFTQVRQAAVQDYSNIMSEYDEPISELDAEDEDHLDLAIENFGAGYISNIDAFYYNGLRFIYEDLHDRISSNQEVDAINESLDAIDFNENTYNLSQTAHLRGMYRYATWYQARKNGITNFRMDINQDRASDLKPTGQVMKNNLFVRNEDSWTKKQANNKNPINGLGLHYNSNEYYTPIPDSVIGQAVAWSKKERKAIVA